MLCSTRPCSCIFLHRDLCYSFNRDSSHTHKWVGRCSVEKLVTEVGNCSVHRRSRELSVLVADFWIDSMSRDNQWLNCKIRSGRTPSLPVLGIQTLQFQEILSTETFSDRVPFLPCDWTAQKDPYDSLRSVRQFVRCKRPTRHPEGGDPHRASLKFQRRVYRKRRSRSSFFTPRRLLYGTL